MPFGERLKQYRNIKGYTLRDVQDKTKINNGYLNQIENDKVKQPSPHVLYKLAELYGVSYGKLMELAGYVNPVDSKTNKKPTSVAFKLIEDLTPEEEAQILTFIEVLKRNRK